MATRRAGPFTVQIPMVVEGMSHDIELNCDVIGAAVTGSDPDDVTLRTKGDGPIALSQCVDTFWGVFRTFFNGASLASTYTLWQRNENNDDRLFISGGTLTAPNGLSNQAAVLSWQAIWTFRSAAGNFMRITASEPVIGQNVRIPLASDTTNGVPALVTYVLSDANWLMARDRSFPVAAMNSSYGQNEKLASRRYRS